MIRELRPDDIPALRALHEQQGFDYPFPDLSQPQFVQILVAVDDEDRPVQALMARETLELYMLGDSGWRTPKWRFATLQKLGYAMHLKLLGMGYRDVHAWLPPQVERAFGKRLVKSFGWVKSRWSCFAREL